MESKSFHLQLNWNQNRIEKKALLVALMLYSLGGKYLIASESFHNRVSYTVYIRFILR